jgi:hypothetical protein
MGKQAINASFLLRLWQVHSEEGQSCRVLLENIRTDEKLGFTSLEDLVIYLKQVTTQENNSRSEGILTSCRAEGETQDFDYFGSNKC